MGDKYKRLAQILEHLYQGEDLRIQTLAKEFKVSTKTIQRDLKEELKSDFLVREGNVFRLKSSKKHQKDAFVLDVLKNLVCGIGGRFQEDACEILEKFQSMSKAFQTPLLDVSEKITEIAKIQDAIRSRLPLSFTYRGGYCDRVQPLGIYIVRRSAYLCGIFDENKRFFRLEEICNPKIARRRLVPSLNQEESEKCRVVLFVYSQASSYFRSLYWGENQTITCDDEQNLIVEFSTSNEEALLQEVLGQIPHVIVLEPQSLKERVERRIMAYIKKIQSF